MGNHGDNWRTLSLNGFSAGTYSFEWKYAKNGSVVDGEDAVWMAQVTFPGGSSRSMDLDPKANEFVLGDTLKQGVYRVRLGTNDVTFCANLLDTAESNIKPREELQLGKYTKVTATTLQRTNMELWRTIASLGLLMLMIEWWYYHRRTA